MSGQRRQCRECRTPTRPAVLTEDGRCPSCVDQLALFTITKTGRVRVLVKP